MSLLEKFNEVWSYLKREASPAVLDAASFVPSPDGANAVALVRDGYRLEVRPGRPYTVPSNTMHDVPSFAEYLRRFASPSTCVVLLHERGANAVFNEGRLDLSARASLVFRPSPEADHWGQLLSNPTSQKQLLTTCRQRPEDFCALPSDANLRWSDVLAMQLAKFEAIKTEATSIEVNELGIVTFAGRTEKVQVSGSIPACFEIEIPMFDGLPTRFRIKVFIEVRPAEKGPPTFMLKAPRWEQTQALAVEAMGVQLRGQLDEFYVGTGTAGHATTSVSVARPGSHETGHDTRPYEA